MKKVPSLEAIAYDYAPQGVKFYYIYKSLAHPESGGYVKPLTLKERLMHVKEAEQRIAGEIPWLCDTIGNDVMHTLGNAPTSEFVIDPDGKIVRKRAWGNARELRKDLSELVGSVENPTDAADLDLKIAPPPKVAPRGVVERIKVPSSMKPLVTRPELREGGTPHYAKLRADTDEQLLNSGKGKLYVGFHLDPIYRVHWNNLTEPIHVEIDSPQGVAMPKSLDGPKVENESDSDPREFLVDVSGWTSDEPLRLTVRYFGCSDEPAFCVPVTQRYTIHRKLDVDSGWAKGRIDPTGSFRPAKPRTAQGRVVTVDVDAGRLVIKTNDDKTREFRISPDTRYYQGDDRKKLGDLKTDDEIRIAFFMREEGPLARDLRAKPIEPKAVTKKPSTTEDQESGPDGKTIVFGYVISMDVEKRILTFSTEAGKEMKVRIAKDVAFRRLDDKPNNLKTLEKGHKVRVEYVPSNGKIPLVKNLVARVDDVSIRLKPSDLDQYFHPPAEYADDSGDYRSPLKFYDGRPAKTTADWQARRNEILDRWHRIMGDWPPLIEKPKIEYREKERREDVTQHRVSVEIAQGLMFPAILLLPDGKGPFPAAVVPYYDPETGAGLGKELRDFGYQLTRRGFVTLSIGGFKPRRDRQDEATIQRLTFEAYGLANCHTALANLPNVEAEQIGIVGHSYGGKKAMFASCLYDKFACAAWSDGGIVFDEKRANVNYWEPWYLGFETGKKQRQAGIPDKDNPRTGAYKQLVEEELDLHELHALMAPRPFLVSGGAEDRPQRWKPLNHAIAVNKLLGYTNRVAMTNRKGHSPTPESNEQIYLFFERFLKSKTK